MLKSVSNVNRSEVIAASVFITFYYNKCKRIRITYIYRC